MAWEWRRWRWRCWQCQKKAQIKQSHCKEGQACFGSDIVPCVFQLYIKFTSQLLILSWGEFNQFYIILGQKTSLVGADNGPLYAWNRTIENKPSGVGPRAPVQKPPSLKQISSKPLLQRRKKGPELLIFNLAVCDCNCNDQSGIMRVKGYGDLSVGAGGIPSDYKYFPQSPDSLRATKYTHSLSLESLNLAWSPPPGHSQISLPKRAGLTLASPWYLSFPPNLNYPEAPTGTNRSVPELPSLMGLVMTSIRGD